MPKQRRPQQNLPLPSVKQLGERVFLPPKLVEIPASLQLTFELRRLGDACFLLCNDACVGTVFGLDLTESNGFGEAWLDYVKSNLEADLLIAGRRTIDMGFESAASVTSRNSIQAKSWRRVAKLRIEEAAKEFERQAKGRIVRRGAPKGIKRRHPNQESIRQEHFRKIERSVIELYDRDSSLDIYRRNAVAKKIGISTKTLSAWLKILGVDFELLVTTILRRKR